MRLPVRLASFAVLPLVIACNDDPPTGGSGQSGIRAVAGADVSDTVDALQSQALVVEVRGPDGRLATGAVVRFQADASRDTTRRNEPALFVCTLTAPTCGPSTPSAFAADTTDGSGRAKVLVRLGHIAGPAVLRLAVPEFGFTDSLTFTVRAGNAARVRAAVTDTALDVGATAALRGRVVDRYDNSRSEFPAMSLGAGTSLTLDAATGIVTAREMGTQYVYARSGSAVDSTGVRVTPAARLVVWSSGERVIRLVNLNGTSVRTLASNIHSDLGAFPRYDASRQRVTFHSGSPATSGGGSPNTLYAVDTSGTPVRTILNTTTGFNVVVAVRQIADGSMLVVGQRAGSNSYSLWRVNTDNSVVSVAAIPGFNGGYGAADISHDGARVAYTVNGELRALTAATGVVVTLDATGFLPRWSAQGDRVAFLSGSSEGFPFVVNADGSGRRAIGTFALGTGIAWSPDGVYVIGRAPSGSALRLIRVSDGNTVLLQYRNANGLVADYWQPDWR